MVKQASLILLCVLSSLNVVGYGMDPDYRQALQLKGKKQYPKSLDLLKRLVEKKPRFVRAYYQIVKTYRAEGKLSDAERYFNALLAHNTGNALAYFGLGLVKEEQYKQTKRLSEADESLGFYSRALQLDPSQDLIYLHYSNLAFRVGRLDQAEALAKRLIRNNPQCAAAHFGLGYIYQLRTAWKQAIASMERAMGLDPNLVDAHHALGIIYNTTGKAKAALRTLEQAERLAERSDDPEYKAISKKELGNTYSRLGDYPKSLRFYQAALKIYQEIDDIEGEGESLNYLGKTHRLLGDSGQSLDYSQRALAIAQLVHNDYQEAFALNEIGLVHYYLGDLQKALENLQQAFKLCQSLNNQSFKGALLNNLAITYASLDDPLKALEYLKQAVDIHRKINDHSEEIINLGNIGNICRKLGDYKNALGYFLESLKIAKSIGDRDSQAVLFKLIGNTYHDLGDSQKALGYYDRTLKMLQETGNKRGQVDTLNSIGLAYLKLGDYALALDHLRRALELGTQIQSTGVLWHTHLNLAKTYSKQEEYQDALDHYQQAVKIIESGRRYLHLAEHKSGYFSQRIEAYEGLVSVLFKLNRHEAAFDYAERARARAFLDMLAESKVDSYQGVDPKLIEKEKEINHNLSTIQKKLRKERDETNRKRLYKELKAQEARLEEMEFDVRRKNPNYARIRYPEVYNLNQVQDILTPGSVLLEYMLGEEGSYLWALTQNRFQAYPLPKRVEIEKKVKQYRNLIHRASDSESSGAELYEMLVKPAESLLSGKSSLVIIPDGVLYYLPFESLIKTTGGPSATGGSPAVKYLVEDYEVAYSPSATVLGLIRKERISHETKKVLMAFGDPVYKEETTIASNDQTREIYDEIGHKFPRLTYSGEEVKGIGKLFSSDTKAIFTRSEATEERVKSAALRDYKIIHFATHAILDEDVPSRSAIILALHGNEDGFLQMREVFNLKLNADLVVLSACRTGLGKWVRGEGLIGMTRAFMYAGAKTVLASLWSVDDKSTSILMQRFYYYLKKGEGKSQALRKAKIDMIRSRGYNKPYYWSGFVLQGEPWEPITDSLSRKWTIFLIPPLLAILFLLVFLRRRISTRKVTQEV